MSTQFEDAQLRMELAPASHHIQLMLDITIRHVLAEQPSAPVDIQLQRLWDHLEQIAPCYDLDAGQVRLALERARAA